MALRARDIMQTDVVSVPPNMPLAQLADFFITERISGVPVIDHGKLVGIVSRSDLVRAFSLERSLLGLVGQMGNAEEFAPGASANPPLPEGITARLASFTVANIMAVDAITVAPDASVREVARLMVERHYHRILVSEGTTVCGVISSLDVARAVADERLR